MVIASAPLRRVLFGRALRPAVIATAVVVLLPAVAVSRKQAPTAASFRIAPVRPVSELRREALAARPPVETGEFRPADLVELVRVVPRVRLEIRYATSNNFLGTPVYEQARAFLQRPAAEALARVAAALRKQGYGVLVFDAYRPWYVTKIFWDATPDDKKRFVADPAQGSVHNRGCALDLTLYTLKTGRAVAMPSGYDEMTDRAYADYAGGTAAERQHREVLRRAMEVEGFTVYPYEWWHYDYRDWKLYGIGNAPFAKIDKATGGRR